LSSGGEETRKLEELLIAKNKQLEGKLTEAKRAADVAAEELKALQLQLADLTRKLLAQVLSIYLLSIYQTLLIDAPRGSRRARWSQS